jgi:hypothetical protein
MNILTLKVVGLWPRNEGVFQFDLYTVYALICVFVFIDGSLLFQITYLVFAHFDLEALVQPIFIVWTATLGSIKVLYFIRNRRIIKQLMRALTDDLFQPTTAEQINLVSPALNIWRKIYGTYWFLVIVTVFLWLFYPLLDKSFHKRQLPIPAMYPYDTTETPFYEISYLHQVIGLFLVAVAGLNVDTLMAALMVYTGAQCDILCDNLRNLEDSSATKSEYNMMLIRCVEHHKKILRYEVDTK